MAAVAATRARSNLREEILAAALRLLREQGVKALTQTRVARAAGIPQGHLTYYFPRRADLLAAVAAASAEQAAAEIARALGGAGWGGAGEDGRRQGLAIMARLMGDRARTRMLIGLVLEAEGNATTRAVVQANVKRLSAMIAAGLGRAPDDPDVDMAVAMIWGVGLMQFVWSEGRPAAANDAVLARLPHWLARLEERPSSGKKPANPKAKRSAR